MYREAESLAYSLAVRAWRGWPRNDGCVIQFGEVCAEEEAAAAMVMVMVWTSMHRSYCTCMWASRGWMIGSRSVFWQFEKPSPPFTEVGIVCG